LDQVIDQVILSQRAGSVEIEVETDDGPTPLDQSVGPRLDECWRSQGAVLVERPVGEFRKA